MSKATPQDVAHAAQQVVPSGDERARAVRALTDFNKANQEIQVTEQNIRLYLALRQLNPSGRVSASMILHQKSTAVSQVLLKQKLWIVPRANFQVLPQDMHQYLVDPSVLADAPPDLDAQSVWILDQAVARTRLGPCVLEFESAFGQRTTIPSPSASQSVPALPAAPASSTPESRSQPAEQGQPQPKRARILSEQKSEPEENSFEQIATATKEAFEKGRFVSSDKNNSMFAEFWLRAFSKHADKFKGASEVPHYTKAYVGFIVRSLLATPCCLERLSVMLFESIANLYKNAPVSSLCRVYFTNCKYTMHTYVYLYVAPHEYE